MSRSESDLGWSRDEIMKAATKEGFTGFKGATCDECGITANVLAGIPEWLCGCGKLNVLPFGFSMDAHENPNLGPTRDVILEAIKSS